MIPSTKELLQHIKINKGQTILDVGCGTGVIALQMVDLVGPTGQVIGSDLNEAMLDVGRKQENGNNIKWIKASAEQLPFDNQSIDIITCQHVLSFCKYDQVFKEFQRVLKIDGKLGLTIWSSEIERLVFLRNQLDIKKLSGLNYDSPPLLKGDLTLLKTLSENNGFEINQLYEIELKITFPNIECAFIPLLVQEKIVRKLSADDCEKLKEILVTNSKKVLNFEQDGSWKTSMVTYVLVATRKT